MFTRFCLALNRRYCAAMKKAQLKGFADELSQIEDKPVSKELNKLLFRMSEEEVLMQHPELVPPPPPEPPPAPAGGEGGEAAPPGAKAQPKAPEAAPPPLTPGQPGKPAKTPKMQLPPPTK